jgi:hypothetical protein
MMATMTRWLAWPGVLLLVSAACATAPTRKEAPVTGVVFFKTLELDVLTDFYTRRIGAKLWMDQGDCRIFRHGSFLFGFCERAEAETCGVITFVYAERAEVDSMYRELCEEALDAPRDNPHYPIYNFFARDPEDRLIEFQVFTSGADWSFVDELSSSG